MTTPLSPLAPKKYPTLPPVAGVRFATVAAGVRYKDRTDVMMALFDAPAAVAGVFTKSKCPSAPVDWCRAHLAAGAARALIVNSGNANAFTGHKGVEAVEIVAKAAAKIVGCDPGEVFMASTGVIGEPLDGTRVARAIGELAKEAAPGRVMDAAKAIMTTDTYPKVATAFAPLGDAIVTLNGIAKGAGMIAPDMATLLSFVFTDAPIGASALQAMLSKSVERSFNAITIDSDTSTSDTLMLFATGAMTAAPRIEDPDDERLKPFRRELDKLLRNLAHQVVRDGEGARKFVEVTVEGVRRARLGLLPGVAQLLRDLLAVADDAHAHAVAGHLRQVLGHRDQHQAHQPRDLVVRALPVLRREGEDRQVLHAAVGEGVDRAHQRVDALLVAVDAGHEAPARQIGRAHV